ncbi:hypothetical protein ACHAXS_012162 [Conticribra weissflogii]
MTSNKNSPPSHSWDNPPPNSDAAATSTLEEQRFIRMYSKALAEALRAKEEEEDQERERLRSTVSSQYRSRPCGNSNQDIAGENKKRQWEKMKLTYRELCFDDPVVSGGNRVCRDLSVELVPQPRKADRSGGNRQMENNKLALSSRLVDGVLQAISRVQDKRRADDAKHNHGRSANDEGATKSPDDQQAEPMLGNATTMTTSEGYAELGFSVFIEGPYRCIQRAEDLEMTSSFLGSFSPPEEATDEQDRNMSSIEKDAVAEETAKKILDGFEAMVLDKEAEEKDENPSSMHHDVVTNKDDNPDDGSSSSSEFFHDRNSINAQHSQYTDDGSMQEIFAEESDPDDYEYESSLPPYTPTPDVAAVFDRRNFSNYKNDYNDYRDSDDDYAFDPLKLSKPNSSNQTWSGSRRCLKYLLSNASYGKMALSSISSRSWSERGMSDTLADLAFMLLLENGKEHREGNNDRGVVYIGAGESLMTNHKNSSNGNDDDDISSLWNRPLFVLRDRAMDATCGHDALPAYIQLLRAFLAHSEEDIISILSSSNSKSMTASSNFLPPTTAVGLSCLANVCSAKEMTCSTSGRICGTSAWSVCPRDVVKNEILSSLGTLARIVECVRPRRSIFGKTKTEELSGENSAECPWMRVVICVIPMMEFLINLRARFDFQLVFEGGGSKNVALSDADAKSLMDSGLFRELLSLYTVTSKSSSIDESKRETIIPKAEDVIRMQLLRTIFALSIQSPSILGAFAIRVPDLAKTIHSDEFMQRHLVDGILWTSLGSSILESKSDLPKSKFKLRPPTKANCKVNNAQVVSISLSERSLSGFEALCNSAREGLESFKEIVQNETPEKSKESNYEEMKYIKSKEALNDIVMFSNFLSNCRHATRIWIDSLKNNDDSFLKTKDCVNGLRSIIATIPSFSDDVNVPRTGHKKDDDIVDGINDDCKEGDVGVIQDKSTGLLQMRREIVTLISSVRSSIKIIDLALESNKETVIPSHGFASYDVSSKTD